MGKQTSFQTDFLEIKRKFKGIKKQIILYIIISIFVSSFLVGYLWQNILALLSKKDTIIILECFKIGFSGFGLIFTFIITIAFICGGYRLYMMFYHDYTIDDDGDFQTSKSGEYGRAHFQNKEERRKNFLMEKDPYALKEDILGYDEDKDLHAINDNEIKGLNKNKVIFGPSGSGKSAAMAIPMIYQNIIRGHSIIVTDSKGDLYKDTCHLAIKHGYVMRVLNLKSGEIKNSDAVDLLKMLKGVDDSDAKAEVLANIIIENSGDGHMDYFAINEMNLLKAIILLVIKPDYASRGKDNLAEVYRICSHNTPESLSMMFMMLDDDDPAREAFSIFDQCEPKVKGQILNGMGIRLNKLSNRYLKEVVSNDEIDLLLPMKRKCIYYVVISDMDSAYKFIATLFFSELFVCLCEYADGMTTEERKKRIPVNFILDEYKNTGSIPNMDQIITTIRSRGITATLFLQNVEQLESMYPDLWETILENVSIKILLKAGGYSTAEWFSKILGTKTIRVTNKRDSRNASDVVESYDSYQVTEGKGERELMKPAELMNELSENDLIMTIGSRQPVKLKKFLDFMHPMYTEAKEKEMLARKHCPKWRKAIIDQQKAAKEEELKQQEEELKLLEEQREKAEQQLVITEKEQKKNKSEKKQSVKIPKPEQTEQSLFHMPDEDDIPATNPSLLIEPVFTDKSNSWNSKWIEDVEDENEAITSNASSNVLKDIFG